MYLYSCNYHSEDGHKWDRNMMVVNMIKLHHKTKLHLLLFGNFIYLINAKHTEHTTLP
jgi:hypothetical protein